MSSSGSERTQGTVQFFLVFISVEEYMCSLAGDGLLVQEMSVPSGWSFLCLGHLRACTSFLLPVSLAVCCCQKPCFTITETYNVHTGTSGIIQVIVTILQKRRGCKESRGDLPLPHGELVMNPGLEHQSDASSHDARQGERHGVALQGLLEKWMLVPRVARFHH